MAHVADADALHSLVDNPMVGITEPAPEPRVGCSAQRHNLAYGDIGRIRSRREHHSKRTCQLRGAKGCRVPSAQLYPTAQLGLQSCHGAQQCRLARTVAAYQTRERATLGMRLQCVSHYVPLIARGVAYAQPLNSDRMRA